MEIRFNGPLDPIWDSHTSGNDECLRQLICVAMDSDTKIDKNGVEKRSVSKGLFIWNRNYATLNTHHVANDGHFNIEELDAQLKLQEGETVVLSGVSALAQILQTKGANGWQHLRLAQNERLKLRDNCNQLKSVSQALALMPRLNAYLKSVTGRCVDEPGWCLALNKHAFATVSSFNPNFNCATSSPPSNSNNASSSPTPHSR